MINVLMIANHSYDSLKPLCSSESVSNLPIAGITVFEHVLEAVARLDVGQVTIAASGNVLQLRQTISKGERWGVNATIVSAKTNELESDIFERIAGLHQNDLLIVPCDRIYIDTLDHLNKLLRQHSRGTQSVHCSQSGLTFVPVGAKLKDAVTLIESGGHAHTIHDVNTYHSACIGAINGSLRSLKLRGKQEAIGLTKGYMTRAHPRTIQSGHVFVGNHCRVHPTCKIYGPVMINHGVSIDRMSHIENSVVLDNTVIGEHLTIKNSIVSGSTVIRVDTNVVIELSDRFIVAERGRGFIYEYLSPVVNRLLGVLLYLITLPVLLMALAAQFLRAPTAVYTQRTFVGNRISKVDQKRQEFVTYIINNNQSPYRYLPMILDVAAGNINLFGVSVLTTEEHNRRFEAWEKISDSSPAGLLGPTQLHFGLNAPLDERLMSDAIVAQSPMGLSESIGLLTQCIKYPFSRFKVTTD